MRPKFVSAIFDNAYILLTLTALFWGGNFVLGRGVAGHIPPIALAFLRWSIATLIILPFAWHHLRKEWPAIRAHWPMLLFLAALGGGSFNTLTYIGLNHTPAINALVLNSSGPIMIAIACFAIYGDRITAAQVAGIGVSFVGVLTILSKGDLDVLLSLSPNAGDLWVLVAMAIWGVYTAYLRDKPKMHWLAFTAVLYFFSAAVNVPFVIWEAATGSHVQFTMTTFLSVAYVSIFPSVLAYIFYNRGVELIGGARAGVFLHLVPMFGALLAIALLGEQPGAFHIAGFALILTGVSIASR